jgi:hypothetical protein
MIVAPPGRVAIDLGWAPFLAQVPSRLFVGLEYSLSLVW